MTDPASGPVPSVPPSFSDAIQVVGDTSDYAVSADGEVVDQASPQQPQQYDAYQASDAQASPVSSQEVSAAVEDTIPVPPAQPAPTQPIDPDSAASLLDLLVKQGDLTPDQAAQVNQESIASGKEAERVIADENMVPEEPLTKARALYYHVPFVRLADIGVSPEALSALSESVARRYNMLPYSLDKSTNLLKVAMENPLDLSAIDFAAQKSGYSIEPYYATPSEVKRTIAERYAQNLSTEVSQALEESPEETQGPIKDLSDLKGNVLRQAPITKIVETILSYAIKSRASDVHIEPQENRTRVRYRVDGILREKLILPKSVQEAVISRIKILSDLKIDEKRVPQDGRFSFEIDQQAVDLRVSTLPTIHGEKIVMRLLKKNQDVPELEELGLRGLALHQVQKAVTVPHGIILVTGPTGSGKTTTLYSILDQISTPKVNILTLEDPVEYQMTGVNQVQINPQAGLTFASGLRSFLRQDPNIVMVGEIRDNETVDLAVQASLTGHLVFSTLHTSSAAGAIPRLVDMEAEPFLLASSLTLTMAQRVVRKINENYREEYQPEPAVVEDVKQVLGPLYTKWCKDNNKDPNQMRLYRATQNRPETEPEYHGRIAIFEVMPITEDISKLILARKPASEMEQLAVSHGMILMKQDGYLKALDGITTIEEVLRVAEV